MFLKGFVSKGNPSSSTLEISTSFLTSTLFDFLNVCLKLYDEIMAFFSLYIDKYIKF